MLKLRLLELRKEKNLTQADIAKYLRITPQAYSLYELGKHHMNNEILCLLADFHSVSTDYLLGRVNDIPSFLNEDERAVINQYQHLDQRAKAAVRNCLAFEYAQVAKKP